MTILIIGDLIIDETYYVNTNRISPEAPVLSVAQIDKKPLRTPGGAGFAAAWANTNGLEAKLITSCTEDNQSLLWFNHRIETFNISKLNINVTKTRYIDKSSKYHLFRLDNDFIAEKPKVSPKQVLKAIKEVSKDTKVSACLLSDYLKGFFSDEYNWSEVINFFVNKHIPVLLDTKAKNLSHWVDPESQVIRAWLKLNHKELAKVQEHMENATEFIFDRLVVTKSANGATFYTSYRENKTGVDIKPTEVILSPVPDVTGCGDIFDVCFLSGLGEGKVIDDAAEIAVTTATKWANTPLTEKIKCLSPLHKD